MIIDQRVCQKNLSKKFVKKICQKNLQTLRNYQHQVTQSNTKVTNSLDGEEKRLVILVLRSSSRPKSGQQA